jgi:hypothetical protein
MQTAYLDPGSGSIIASVLVGGVAGIGVAARSWKARVGGAFRRKPDAETETPTDSGSDEETSVPTDA